MGKESNIFKDLDLRRHSGSNIQIQIWYNFGFDPSLIHLTLNYIMFELMN